MKTYIGSLAVVVWAVTLQPAQAGDRCLVATLAKPAEVRPASERRQALALMRQQAAGLKNRKDAAAIQKGLDRLEVKIQARELHEAYGPYCPLSPTFNAYLVHVQKLIEDCGTANFPKKYGAPMYGIARASMSFDRDGNVTAAEIDETSLLKELDDHVLKVIHAVAPFGQVPSGAIEEQYREFKVIDIPFHYTRDSDTNAELRPSSCKL